MGLDFPVGAGFFGDLLDLYFFDDFFETFHRLFYRRNDVARQHFEKAAAKDSSWPWPHLGLAYLYSRNGPLGDPEKLDMEVSALLSLCPTSDASFTYLSEVRNPEVKRRF